MASLKYNPKWLKYYGESTDDVPEGLQVGDKAYFFDTEKNVVWDGSVFVDDKVNAEVEPPITATTSDTKLVTITTAINGVQIVEANTNRYRLAIQNNGTQPVLISIDDTLSTSSYNFILAGSSEVRIGDGGAFIFESWKGQVRGLTEVGTSVVSILEEVMDDV